MRVEYLYLPLPEAYGDHFSIHLDAGTKRPRDEEGFLENENFQARDTENYLLRKFSY